MDLTPDETERLKTSMAALKTGAEPAATDFYDRLFRIAPELRPMFREDMAEQGMRFMSTLGLIVDAVGDETALAEKLDALGEGHRGMGVRAEHFAPMKTALLATMHAHLGAGFTPETEAAWSKAYDQMAARMARA